MTDVPGENGNPNGTRQYEIQVLAPNLNRAGERWRVFGLPFDELAKAEYALTDLVNSMLLMMDSQVVLDWRLERVRVMEIVTTRAYGKEIKLS